MLMEARLLSPDGKCYAFDSRASRSVVAKVRPPSSLKSLEDALQDRDPIRAVIRETAANQDGRTPTITSLSLEA